MNIPAMAHEQEDEAFSANTVRRLFLNMAVLLVAGAAVLWAKYRAGVVLSFVLGGGISLVNFYWLKRSLSALVDAVALRGEKRSPTGVLLRFMLRYVLIALAAYAIFKSSEMSLYGLCAGLSLPVGAVLIEAAYVLYGALQRGF